jgi:uncharacterized protein YccT (UPF0319 family)
MMTRLPSVNTLCRLAAFTAALALTAQVQAASLTVPDAMTIESINGEAVNLENAIGLPLGPQLVELNYQGFFQVNADDTGPWVRSETLYLTLDVEQHQRYQIQLPAIDTEDDAHEFLENPQITLRVNGKVQDNLMLLTQSQLLTQLLINPKSQ